jgi:hypothetical protein
MFNEKTILAWRRYVNKNRIAMTQEKISARSLIYFSSDVAFAFVSITILTPKIYCSIHPIRLSKNSIS